MPHGRPWPRISVVTPSYNQGEFIEETIRSVLLQGYPDLEYIVIDGGSADQSAEIIRKYQSWLSFSVSESDRGQTHAINKGLARSTGDCFNWINSDDLLLPGALEAVAVAGGGTHAVGGAVVNFSVEDPIGVVIHNQVLSPISMIKGDPQTSFHQPGLWLLRKEIGASGGIDESLHYAFDWDLTIRYTARCGSPLTVDRPLARFRLHGGSKTVTQQARFHQERLKVLRKLADAGHDEELRTAAMLVLRRHSWWAWLAQQSQDRRPRLLKIVAILAHAMRDPAVRLNRLTLGALKQALLKQR